MTRDEAAKAALMLEWASRDAAVRECCANFWSASWPLESATAAWETRSKLHATTPTGVAPCGLHIGGRSGEPDSYGTLGISWGTREATLRDFWPLLADDDYRARNRYRPTGHLCLICAHYIRERATRE